MFFQGREVLKRVHPIRLAALLVLTLAVAALVYFPWYRFVEAHGGYGRLLEHHRSYVDGVGSWPANLRTQLAQVVALSGGPKWLLWGWGFAWILCGWVRHGMDVFRREPVRMAAGAVLGGLGLVLLPSAGWWVGLAALPFLVRGGEVGPRLLAAWWIFLTAITPLYHPYARLWLPLHAVGWLLLAGVVVKAWDWKRQSDHAESRVSQRGWVWGAAVAVVGVLTYWGASPRAQALGGLLGPTDALRRGLETHVRGPFPADLTFVRVLARPQVTFYLGLENQVAFMTYVGVDRLLTQAQPGDWLLVDEVLLRQEPDPKRALERVLAACDPTPLGEWSEVLSPAVLLDVDPAAAFGDESARRSRWWLLRFVGPGGGAGRSLVEPKLSRTARTRKRPS